MKSTIGSSGLALTASIFLLLLGCTEQQPNPQTTGLAVTAFAETEPVVDDDDAADDPYIMVVSSSEVIIAGTNKRRGVELYDLQGRKLAGLDSGRVNNVDGVFDSATNTFRFAGSNRTNVQVDVYEVTTGPVELTLARTFDVPMEEPYGLCVSPSAIYVGDTEGLVQAWSWQGEGPLASYQFATKTEGCVVDVENNHLYVGEEMTAIWRVDLASDAEPTLFAEVDGVNLVGDVEGLDIYTDSDRRILLASSQGDSTFVAYDLATAEQLAKFSIAATPDSAIDGAEDTDGIAVTNASLTDHPKGILVVQDGFNFASDQTAVNQNFKMIDWRSVDALLAPVTQTP